MFKALVVREIEPNKFTRKVENVNFDFLNNNEILVKVHYSSLNYKDALSARGHKGISKYYPHIPGVDASGIIEQSNSQDYKVGDKVIVTGYDLGMNTKGGFAEYISVPAEWLIKLPDNLTLEESMMYGTAGFTAAICVDEIIKKGILPQDGDVLVTGATGGVGIMAVGILAKLGYKVVASTGKMNMSEKLMQVGAYNVIDRNDLIDNSGRPLLASKYIAAIDNVGGATLSSVFRAIKMHGIVCVLGNVSGDTFETNVYPFLLRGVSMIGIDSASKSSDLRQYLWNNLANDWKIDNLKNLIKEVKLDGLSEEIDRILKGQQFGRILVNLK
ncbi:MAG TPA: YhdH/YhfP family quinone oxidoreductase [Candidatus Kapabacteria bacterium]|nr:YhdH/YhfP family quinone oxidoreductase [Candidatus Kapabacteria bacterium]